MDDLTNPFRRSPGRFMPLVERSASIAIMGIEIVANVVFLIGMLILLGINVLWRLMWGD